MRATERICDEGAVCESKGTFCALFPSRGLFFCTLLKIGSIEFPEETNFNGICSYKNMQNGVLSSLFIEKFQFCKETILNKDIR